MLPRHAQPRQTRGRSESSAGGTAEPENQRVDVDALQRGVCGSPRGADVSGVSSKKDRRIPRNSQKPMDIMDFGMKTGCFGSGVHTGITWWLVLSTII